MIEKLGVNYCDCKSLLYSLVKGVIELKNGRAHMFASFPGQGFPG